MKQKLIRRNPNRAAVFDFIVRYKCAHDGNSPTLEEMGRELAP